MLRENLLNNNALNSKNNNSLISSVLTSQQNTHQWLTVKREKDLQSLLPFYINICQKHQNKSKWILIINPDNNSLSQLSHQSNMDISKVLRVNIPSKNLDIECIAKALNTGNCATVIVSKSQLKKGDVKQLSKIAKKGKTQCIIVENNITIH